MMSEHAIQVQLVKLLHAYGRGDIAWWAVPNGGWRDIRTAGYLKAEGVRRGVADLNFLIDGKFIAVELKTEKGRLSREQENFGQDVQRAGGFFFVAFGLNDAIGVLHGISAFRKGVSFTTPFSPVKRRASRRRASPDSQAAHGAR